MTWNIFFAVTIGLLTVFVAGLAGHLASTKPWQKWAFWGSGLVIVMLVYFQARAYKEPPTAGEIAEAVIKKQSEEVKSTPDTSREKEKPSPVPPPTTSMKKKKAPAPEIQQEQTGPNTSASPQLPSSSSPKPARLVVSQTSEVSSRPDAPYKTEVVVQTSTEFPTLKLLLQCNKPLVDGSVNLGQSGVTGMTSQGIVPERPNLFLFSYQFAAPPFGPSNPIIFNLWSKEPMKCEQAATF